MTHYRAVSAFGSACAVTVPDLFDLPKDQGQERPILRGRSERSSCRRIRTCAKKQELGRISSPVDPMREISFACRAAGLFGNRRNCRNQIITSFVITTSESDHCDSALGGNGYPQDSLKRRLKRLKSINLA